MNGFYNSGNDKIGKTNNKRIIPIFIFVDLLLIIACCFIIIYSMRLSDSMRLNVYFGESHVGQSNIAQLFYADDVDGFSENDVLTEVFEDDKVSFSVNEIDFGSKIIRLDPFNRKRDFSINRLEFTIGDHSVFSVEGKEIKSYVDDIKGMKAEVTDDGLLCKSKKNNPRLIFKKSFSKQIYRWYLLLNRAVYVVVGILLVCIGIIEVLQVTKESKKTDIFYVIITELLMVIGTIFVYAVRYFENHFGQVPFGQLIYHLHTPLDGTDVSSYIDVIVAGLVIVLLLGILNLIIYKLLKKKCLHFGYVLWMMSVAVVIISCSCYRFIEHFEVVDYYHYTHESTTLYEDNYVDGRDINLKFPEKKRNLIYIFLESMEVSFSDTGDGGAMGDNLIPNLTKLALENDCFSDGSRLNGAYHVSGATYTMGALAAQTSAVPINEAIVSNETLNGSWESENNYLPGVWSIGDVLEKEGYNQEFLIGSKGEFAGRSSYFKGHGNYKIEDYDAAIEEKRIPRDYKVWWGYEDEKLFQFAKEDLISLSKEDKPFNLTMLTVDTHFTGGYKCDLCEDKYDSQYSNVIACSDGQVAEFIEWVKNQDFYDNTTIVICGDHLTPDSFYINEQGVASFDRRTYTAVINPADGKKYTGEGRTYTTLDMYPTTLSAMGVSIDGDRLGLGVDLYSDTPTLVEQYGLDNINYEIMKNSDYYTEKLLYKVENKSKK